MQIPGIIANIYFGLTVYSLPQWFSNLTRNKMPGKFVTNAEA